MAITPVRFLVVMKYFTVWDCYFYSIQNISITFDLSTFSMTAYQIL